MTTRVTPELSVWRPQQAVLAIASAIALAAPTAAWFDLVPSMRTALVPAAMLLVPGASVGSAVLGARRGLWIGMTPAISLATAVLVTSAQMALNGVSPPLMLSAAALLHFLALPRAWAQASALGLVTIRTSTLLGTRRLLSFAALTVALLLWWRATAVVDLDRADAFGVLRIAPWQYWLSLALVAAVAATAIGRAHVDRLVAALSGAVLAVLTYAFASVADGTPVAPTTFVHLGIIDAIDTLGFLPQAIDARFSWPGFFVAAAAVADAADLGDLVPALVWWPVALAIMAMPAVFNLGRAVGRSERSGWIAVFVFLGANWVQQDYFSPQSVAFLIFVNLLAVLAVELADSKVPPVPGPWLLKPLRLLGRTPGRAAGWGARRTIAVELLLVALIAAMVVGHQLTPLAVVFCTALMSLLGVTRHRTLWLAAVTLMAAWFAFGATDWWTGNLGSLLRDVGQVDQAVSRGAVSRVGGDEWYARMQLARIAWSAAIAGVAGVGWLLIRRSPAASFAVAAVTGPIALIAVQSYGGEIVLRIFLYTSPVLAVLAAIPVARLSTRWPRAAVGLLTVCFLALSVGFTVTRNVNVAFERTPRDVLDAARQVLEDAPPRAAISPLRAEGVLQQRRLREVDSPADIGCERTPLECILAQEPDYVFLTRTRDLFDHLRSGTLLGYSRSLAEQLTTSGRYEATIDTPNVIVLRKVVRPGLVEPGT